MFTVPFMAGSHHEKAAQGKFQELFQPRMPGLPCCTAAALAYAALQHLTGLPTASGPFNGLVTAALPPPSIKHHGLNWPMIAHAETKHLHIC